MQRTFLIFVSFLVYFSCISATSISASASENNAPQSLEEYCQTAPCRKNHNFKLRLKDGTYYEHSSELDPPAVQPAFILIFPGEELFIEASEGKDAPQDFKHVPENIHPERTLVFKFTQPDAEKGDTGMLLNVHNPFSKPLRYHLAMTPLGKERAIQNIQLPSSSTKKVV